MTNEILFHFVHVSDGCDGSERKIEKNVGSASSHENSLALGFMLKFVLQKICLEEIEMAELLNVTLVFKLRWKIKFEFIRKIAERQPSYVRQYDSNSQICYNKSHQKILIPCRRKFHLQNAKQTIVDEHLVL